MTIQAIQKILNQFQNGYKNRDAEQLDHFMETLFTKDQTLEIIGTNAEKQGQGEWCHGFEAAKELIGNDWAFWGDVRFDFKNAQINLRGDTAWIATYGTVTDTIPFKDRHEGFVDYVDSVVKDETMTPAEKMLDIVQLGNDLTAGILTGETFTWPFRFTAILVREADAWKFHHLHYSFPTVRAPQVCW